MLAHAQAPRTGSLALRPSPPGRLRTDSLTAPTRGFLICARERQRKRFRRVLGGTGEGPWNACGRALSTGQTVAEFDTSPITPKPTTPRSCAVTPRGLGQGGEDEAGAASRQALGLLGARFSTGRVFRGAQRARAGRGRARLTVSTSSAAGSPQTHARPAPLSRAPFSRPCSLFAGFRSVCSLFLYLLNDLEHFFFFPFRTHKWA